MWAVRSRAVIERQGGCLGEVRPRRAVQVVIKPSPAYKQSRVKEGEGPLCPGSVVVKGRLAQEKEEVKVIQQEEGDKGLIRPLHPPLGA